MERPAKKLDADALDLFARKGLDCGGPIPQSGEANGVKVRRVLQVISDLMPHPISDLRILDLGCGEGVYSIELGLLGAEVIALDARNERMDEGAAVARRHGLTNVSFEQRDVREIHPESHGHFDVVLLLGLLYHLEAPSLFVVLENIKTMCRGMLLIDTLISLDPDAQVEHRGVVYEGELYREHGDDDTAEVRKGRLLRSIDNTFSFRLSKGSLVTALHEVGFSSILECHAPLEPGKADDRITFAALSGERVDISTYPWLNGMSDSDIARRLDAIEEAEP